MRRRRTARRMFAPPAPPRRPLSAGPSPPAPPRRPLSAARIARLIARWVFPTPGGPRNTTFSFRRRKSSSWSESICSRRREGWNVKSKSASLFTAGSRLDRIAASRRRLFRSAICAPSNCSIASLPLSEPLSTGCLRPLTRLPYAHASAPGAHSASISASFRRWPGRRLSRSSIAWCLQRPRERPRVRHELGELPDRRFGEPFSVVVRRIVSDIPVLEPAFALVRRRRAMPAGGRRSLGDGASWRAWLSEFRWPAASDAGLKTGAPSGLSARARLRSARRLRCGPFP